MSVSYARPIATMIGIDCIPRIIVVGHISRQPMARLKNRRAQTSCASTKSWKLNDSAVFVWRNQMNLSLKLNLIFPGYYVTLYNIFHACLLCARPYSHIDFDRVFSSVLVCSTSKYDKILPGAYRMYVILWFGPFAFYVCVPFTLPTAFCYACSNGPPRADVIYALVLQEA